MKYCSKCGKQLMDEAVVCPQCGCAANQRGVSPNTNDAPNAGFALLGFLIPIVGLIMYLSMRDQTPQRAGSAGKGALVGFIVGFIGWIISLVIYFVEFY